MKFEPKKILFILGLTVFFLAGVWLRLYHIDFGLPHSFHADEPEIAELAIKYTYEIRDIIKNNNYYKLIPISFVYGTFPSYLFTFAVMAFSKVSNLLNNPFSKEELYVFMRTFNALLSTGIIITIGCLYKKLFASKKGLLLIVLLLSLNWKLIVHAHYVNADILLTLIMSGCFLLSYLYYEHKLDDMHVVLMGLLYGIAVGTKITALISAPLFLYLFLIKKDYRGLFGFFFLTFLGFIATNPFSLVLIQDFVFRIYTMKIKEAGLVFDSVDTNPVKYGLALISMVGIPVLLASVFGSITSIKSSDKKYHLFLLGNILVYVLFYSLNARRVDRWLLPVLPLVLMYGAEGLAQLFNKTKTYLALGIAFAIFGLYLYYPYLLTKQFARNTPKSEAYLWAQKTLPPLATKLVITEEGLDPFSKLEGAKVIKYEVYESDQAYLKFPPNPKLYNYVVLASRPMQNFKREEVIEKYPVYSKAWSDFENTVLDSSQFSLIKEITLPKPNLVELSDVYIYQNKAYR
jgi:hypothetical protein